MTRTQRWHQPVVVVAESDASQLRHLLRLASDAFRVVVEPSLERLAQSHTSPLILMSVNQSRDWQALDRLVQSRAHVVVVLAQSRPDHLRRAWIAGAMGVVSSDAVPGEIVDALHAARRGRAVLPAALLRRMLAPSCSALPTEERRLLEELSTARTFAEIAHQHGCSERTLYRRVQRLYVRLQVSGRKEAVRLWMDSHGDIDAGRQAVPA